MDTPNNDPDYAAIQHHIRHARIERIVAVSETLSGFIAAVWREIERPPRPAAIIINGRYPWTGVKGNLALPR
jgi:hypothetical protein